MKRICLCAAPIVWLVAAAATVADETELVSIENDVLQISLNKSDASLMVTGRSFVIRKSK
jgi:hypothetical protein